jgi:putative ABC transport system permease protein
MNNWSGVCRKNRRSADFQSAKLFPLDEPGGQDARATFEMESFFRFFRQTRGNAGGSETRPYEEDMNTLWQDIKYGIRMLLKNPGFSLFALMTLVLGIGANTAIFSVMNGVLLRPLPFKNVQRIVTIWQENQRDGIQKQEVSPGNFFDWRERARLFAGMAAAERFGFDLDSQGEPERLHAWLVTQDFFKILGTSPLYGRVLTAEDYKPGNENVVLLSHGLWVERFGSNPNVIGETIRLSSKPYTIVGVMRPEFQFPATREIWGPKIFPADEQKMRGENRLVVIGRLQSGVTIQQAQAQMNSISSQLAEEYPKANANTGAKVTLLREDVVGEVRPALLVLFVAVGFVLLIGCANVANLLLTRGTERKKELAIRLAMGATRFQLVRLMFIESLMLALLGGIGGVLLAGWILDVLTQLSPSNLPRLDEIRIDPFVLAFSFGISVFTSIIFGLIPSLQLSKTDIHDTLKSAGSAVTAGLHSHFLRNILIVSEVALSLILLIGAGLLARSFVDLLKVDLGYSPDRVMALQVFTWARHPKPEDRAAFLDHSIQRLSALPGVEAAGAVSALPLMQLDADASFSIQGKPALSATEQPSAYYSVATPDYFRVMKIPLKEGRFFSSFDRSESTPVALINESLSRRYFPNENAIGKKITINLADPFTVEIVGVVGDSRHDGFAGDTRSEIFVPHLQDPFGSMAFVVRTSSNPQNMLSSIKREIWNVDKYQTFAKVIPMTDLVSESIGGRRFNLALLASFAISALVLASIGIYGLLSFTISQRSREIGIRLALGARTNDILRMVLREGMMFVVIGIALGIAGSLLLTRFLQDLLFHVSTTDPVVFALVSFVLSFVALCACYIPAKRASKVDPLVALRYE